MAISAVLSLVVGVLGAAIAATPAGAEVDGQSVTRVGYYDLGSGEGADFQVPPIEANGFEPVKIEDLSAEELADIDVLFVTNGSNSSYASEWVAQLDVVDDAVAAGLALVFHDRFVTDAADNIPGAEGIDFTRETSEEADEIDVRDDTTLVTNGPGGTIDDDTLDGGDNSSHGFGDAATFPPDSILILSRSDQDHIVTGCYPHSAGTVTYSTIPLDFYLGGSGENPPADEFREIYAPNVIAYAATGTCVSEPPVLPADGYYLFGADSGVFAFGEAGFFGTAQVTAPSGALLNAAVVDGTASPSGAGYWMAASDGGVFAFGDAGFFGSLGAVTLNEPIVGIANTPTGGGYWLAASDGGVFSFGDASFLGSMGGMPLNQPIVGIVATPTGDGYWLVASDGGVFSFGDASFLGSMGGTPLNEPVVAIISTGSGAGYWLVASDGGVFSFGDASFLGSMGAVTLNQPITAAASTGTGAGYWMAGEDGGVFSFGDATFFGSLGGMFLNQPIVGMGTSPGQR